MLSTVIGPLGAIFYVLAFPVNLVVLKKKISPKLSGIQYWTFTMLIVSVGQDFREAAVGMAYLGLQLEDSKARNWSHLKSHLLAYLMADESCKLRS